MLRPVAKQWGEPKGRGGERPLGEPRDPRLLTVSSEWGWGAAGVGTQGLLWVAS